MPVQCTCPICGTAFSVDPYRTRQGRTLYCSTQCSYIGISIPLADRFWTHVNKTGTCWRWTGYPDPNGYAKTRRGGYRNGQTGVHVVAFEMASGTRVEKGSHIGHTCDVRLCVRNDDAGVYIVAGVEYPRFGHLFMCPPIANESDKVAKGRQAKGATNGRSLHPDSYPKGTEWPMAKLTDDQVMEMRRIYDARLATQVTLAAQYGMTQAAVWAIVRRKTWKHLP